MEAPSWCVVGSSDSTLYPADAIRQADDAARMHAASRVLGSRVRAAERSSSGADEPVSVAIDETRGRMRGVAVLGWWRDVHGEGPHGQCETGCNPNTVWAVACPLGAERLAPAALPQAFAGDLPQWLAQPPSARDRLCAVGMSGPTLHAGEASSLATEDGRRRLAMLRCTEVDDVRVDRGTRAWRFVGQRPSGDAVEDDSAEEIASWVDTDGIGPLGEPGRVYALVCGDHRPVDCRVPSMLPLAAPVQAKPLEPPANGTDRAEP